MILHLKINFFSCPLIKDRLIIPPAFPLTVLVSLLNGVCVTQALGRDAPYSVSFISKVIADVNACLPSIRLSVILLYKMSVC